MNRNQFLLMKVAEECAEVSQRAIKSIQYGAEEVQQSSPSTNKAAETFLSNRERLSEEVIDLFIMLSLVSEAGEVDAGAIITFEDAEAFEARKKAKIEKLNKYLAYSRKLGVIGGDWKI